MVYQDVHNELLKYAKPDKAAALKRYFKTGPGEYGAGDQFLGVMVPESRLIAQHFLALPRKEVTKLLQSKIHEERLIALFILVRQFERGDEIIKKEIFELYLANTATINNWDLVDSSAPQIVGGYLFKRPRHPLDKLAQSPSLWERRIAMLATQAFIRHNDYALTLRIAKTLLTDQQDLIHKAVGWMLREIGNRSLITLLAFLDQHAPRMPRTMLRYAIEKLPSEQRANYLGRKQRRLG